MRIRCSTIQSRQVLRSRDKLTPVRLGTLPTFPGAFGPQISRIVEVMLKTKPQDRPTVERLIERWRTPFVNVAKLAHALEGRVF